jgi:hypothetical protein
MKKIFNFVFIIIIFVLNISCFGFKHYRTNSDFILIEDIESPNREFQIVIYNFDIGALGYSRVFWAIVPMKNINVNMAKYLLPDGYKAIGWTEQNELLIEKWEPYYYKQKEIDLKTGDFYLGVKLVVNYEIRTFIKAP